MFSVNLEQTAVPATPGRRDLFFFFGSNVAFSFFQTRPWLVFRCYVNFFLSLSGLAREKWALGPGFSSFPSPAHENQAPSPNFSSSPHPAPENQSHSPSKARFPSLCKPFFHAPRITTFQTNTPASAPHRSYA